jgi:hypothetical protein
MPEAPERPRVLLLYANPAVTASPVAPYGMECVGHAFRAAGCDVALEMPWLEDDPVLATQEAIATFLPRLVGLSVRNLDDALVVRAPDDAGVEALGDIDTTFYLDEVRTVVAAVVALVGKDNVIVGGPAMSAGSAEVARYLGVRWVFAGPSEDLAWRLGRAMVTTGKATLPADARIVDAEAPPSVGVPATLQKASFAAWRPVPGPTPRTGDAIRLAAARHGRIAVAIATGCDRRCVFCVEPAYTGGGVRPREVQHIVQEVGALAQAGVRRFWLACSEGNVRDARHLVTVLDALRAVGLAGPGVPVDYALFLQPAPVDDALLDALEGAGIHPTTLSFEFGHLDDTILRAGGGPANRSQLDRLLHLWLRRGYRQLGGSILLGAHPQETERSVGSALDTALVWDRALPEGFGLAYACGARVYPGSPLARLLDPADPAVRADLYVRAGDRLDENWVRPVVFSRPGRPRELLARVRAHLAGARGPMRPMNAEAAADPRELEAEQAVNRGIVRRGQKRHLEAAAQFNRALTLRPQHKEALAQAAQLYANDLGEPTIAGTLLTRLFALMPEDDPRRAEVLAALSALGSSRGDES